MSQSHEGHFSGYKNTSLYYQSWEVSQPRGAIIGVHGLGAHTEMFQDFSLWLNSQNWNLYTFDLRGHGRSPGLQGHIDSFDLFEKDLHCFKTFVQKENPSIKNWNLLGTSLGGLICIKNILAYGSQNFSHLLLLSPAVGTRLVPSAIKLKAAKMLLNLWPSAQFFNEIEYEHLAHSPETQEFYKKDPYFHRKISVNLYAELLQILEQLPHLVKNITLPVLIQASKNDPIIPHSKVREIFESLNGTKKTLLNYNKSLHNIWDDVERETLRKDLLNFIDPELSKEEQSEAL